MSENLKNKLTSRKFWIAIAGIITSCSMLLTSDENIMKMINGTILMIADLAIYIFAEAQIDTERNANNGLQKHNNKEI